MSNTRKKVLSMLLGFGLVSIFLYSVVYMISATRPSLAIPPKQEIPTPTPVVTPTPTPPPGTPTPTPTPTTPPAGRRLEIQTIPQDDQLREKGIMIGDVHGFNSFDDHAEYKFDIRLDWA